MAASATKSLSKKLHSCLVNACLSQMQSVLAQCGVRSCHCLATLAADASLKSKTSYLSF